MNYGNVKNLLSVLIFLLLFEQNEILTCLSVIAAILITYGIDLQCHIELDYLFCFFFKDNLKETDLALLK